MSGAPEGMTLCNGVACGLRGRRQLIVVGLLHVRVQRQGGGHCEVDSRAAWWWTVVRAKGEEEAKEGYSGGVVGMTLCSKFWRRNGKKKFIMYIMVDCLSIHHHISASKLIGCFKHLI